MKKITTEANKILNQWYNSLSYSEDNISCNENNEFNTLLENYIFTDKELVKEINRIGKDFIIDCNIKLLNFISEELKDDRDLILQIIRVNGANLELVNTEFKNDKEIALLAIKSNNESFKYVSDSLKDDNDIINLALKGNLDNIKYASDRFKNDKKVAISLANINGTAIVSFEEYLRNDVDVLLACWNNIRDGLFYDEFRLQRDTTILLNNMGSKIKPYFNNVNIQTDCQSLRNQIQPIFDKLISIDKLHTEIQEELNPSTIYQAKKVKL